MKMNAMAAGAILAALASSSVVAQSTVAEILDAGGKALSKADLVALLSGASVSGPTPAGGQISRNVKADGTFTGNVQTAMGKNAPQTGEWTVADDGQFCVTSTTQFRESTGSNKSCGFYYKLGDKYFAALEGGEPNTRVLERVIKK